MTTNNNIDALFADAELPFGHQGRRFDDTPEYFDHSPLVDQGPEPDYTPDEDGGAVHYAPGDRPLCADDGMTGVYSADPAAVAGCGGRLRRLLGTRRRGPQRLPRPLPPLPAADHRPGRSRMAPGHPEALSSLR